MLRSCPESVDVTDLQFKLQCRLKIFENKDASLFSNTNSLVTCASRYGLLFVGSNSNHFQVIQTKILHNYNPKDKDVIDYSRRIIQIPSIAKHLCVNCDSTVLAVVIEKDQCPIVIFYDVLSFLSQNIRVIKEVRLSSTPTVFVREINWNPSLPPVFTACKSDGSLGVYELKGESIDINELPVAAGVTCFCWSPKGKQIAVGSKDGKITQYKPDLKAVKAIGEPKIEGPHTIISLQWVSNYQFIGVYQAVQDGASYLIVIDAPKTGEPTYTNYEDICYSGSSRSPQFYLILQQNWNFLMVASANSAEVGVLGSNGETWTQWIMQDTGRAELPLTPDHQETLPVGLTFDVSPTTPLPWGESSIPPCPFLCILSNYGILCCFNVVYLKEGVPTVCTPPDPVSDIGGLSSFVTTFADNQRAVERLQPKPQQTVPKPAEIKFGITAPQLQPVATPLKENIFASNIQISQSTPLVTGKIGDLPSKTLFGGRTSLTPIKPQQPFFGGQTSITPIIKGANGAVTTTAQSTNISEKYSSIFSSLNPTSSSQINAAPVKPIVISASSVTAEATVKPQEVPIKPQEQAPLKPQVTEPKTQAAPIKDPQKSTMINKQDTQLIDSEAETSAMIYQMIRDEWMYLEAELKVLMNLGRAVKVNVGTDEEKVKMIDQIESLQNFLTEVVDISVGQSNEIHYLKQNLIQSWAWYEEAKSQYNSSKNEAIALLIKSQPLDSLSQKRYKDIKQLIYYIDSQIMQASKTLDEQWDNFQDYAKKTHKAKMPTMETIFQTMVRQQAILQKQAYFLKDISMRLGKKTSNMNSFLLSLDKYRDLAEDFQELSINPQTIAQLQYEKIKSHAKHMTEAKARNLRGLLSERKVTKVTALKPQLSSWTINQSPAGKMRQSISRLSTSTTPVSKTSVAKNLDFAETTTPSQEVPNLLKTEKPAFGMTSNATSTPNTFSPLLKSGPVISSSQGSAFTPIGGTAWSTAEIPQPFFKAAVPPFSFGGAGSSTPQSAIANAVVTAAPNKVSFSLGSANTVFKSTPDSSAGKTDFAPAANAFPFGSSAATPRNVWGTSTASITNNSAFSSNSASGLAFSIGSNSSIFGKPNVTSPTTQSPASSANKIVTTSATNLKPAGGVASILTNLQSVIDKATSTTAAAVSSVDNSKPTLSFSAISTAAAASTTTTTQSGIGTVPSVASSANKPLFGSFTSTDSGSLFRQIPKPVIDSTQSSTTQKAMSSNSPSLSSIFGKPMTADIPPTIEPSPDSNKIPEVKSPEVKVDSQPVPTNVISVSLFGSKSTPSTTVAPNTASVFGSNATSSPSQSGTNIFANLAVASTAPDTTSTTPLMFGLSKSVASTTTVTTTTNATKSSVFGASAQPTSIFAKSTSTTATADNPTSNSFPVGVSANVTSTGSIFGTGTGAPGTFSSTTSSIFSSTAANKSVFGNVVSTTMPSAGTFVTPSTTTVASVFGAAATPTSTFGTPPPVTKANIFGSSATGSIFGAASSPSTTGNIFASPTAENTAAFGSLATTATTSLFGSTAPVTTSSGIFGTNTTSATSPFGSQSTSIFGSSNTTNNTFANFGSNQAPFGGAQATTASPIFGQPSAFGTSQTTAFGTTTAAVATTSGSIFGNTASSSSGFGSGFGTVPTTTTFGSSMTTQPAAGNFGFGGLNVGGSSPSGSIFGGGGNTAGTFGQTPVANPFGKVENKPAFGSSSSSIFGNAPSTSTSGSIFGSPASTTQSIFGANSGSTFGTPTTGDTFGSPSAFGASTFGQKPSFVQPAAFGSSSFGSAQSGGFSGAAVPVAQTGFGTSAAFQKPSGFGSAPVFGGSPAPAFGSAPSFGGSPGFGGAATFGSPEKVFGSNQPASGGFAAGTQQSAGFGNIASQNTIGFGNLAQQANTPTSMPFSGNASFSSWR